MSKPEVLVIGGGFAGLTLAQDLSNVANVTLVDRKGYFELTWALVRAFIDEKIAEKVTVPYSAIPNLGKFITGTVVSLTAKDATLSDGTVIPFDHVAICSGCVYGEKLGQSAFTSTADRREELKAIGEEVAAASGVLIVGGGPSGVEIASEIVEAHPGKKVTLVHSKARLLDTIKEGAGAAALKWLESKGVKVLLDDRVERDVSPGTITTKKGVTVEASKVFWCIGSTPNTSFLDASLSGIVDDKGLIKVDKTLTVEGYPNMWAIGDINNVPETKKGFLATKQANMVAKNFIAKLKKPTAKQAEWVPGMGFEAMFVSMGPKYGVGQMGSWVVTGWVPTYLKSRGLFIDSFRKEHKIVA